MTQQDKTKNETSDANVSEVFLRNARMTTNLFTLSNGTSFPFRAGYEPDTKCVYSPTLKHFEAMASTKKESLLVLYGNKSQDSLIFADFDRPSMDYGIFPSYFILRIHLKLLLGNAGVAFPSASGKVKVAFAVKGKVSDDEARAFLKMMLPDFYNKLDIQHPSLNWTFINVEAAKLICEKLPNLVIHNTTKCHKDKKTHDWNYYTKSIEAITKEFKLNRSEEIVIRFLFGSALRACFYCGIQLPTTYIAETCGFNIHRTSIGNAIETLKLKGLLEEITGFYQPGRKAKSYRAAGIALDFCRSIIAEIETRKANRASRTYTLQAPESVEVQDGEWNDSLFKLTFGHKTEESYLAYVSRIPGFDEKPERAKQARASWKSRAKYLLEKAKKLS